MQRLIFTLSTLAAATALALAQHQPTRPTPTPHQSPDELFKILDKDGDGKVTLEEFKTPRPPAPADAPPADQ